MIFSLSFQEFFYCGTQVLFVHITFFQYPCSPSTFLVKSKLFTRSENVVRNLIVISVSQSRYSSQLSLFVKSASRFKPMVLSRFSGFGSHSNLSPISASISSFISCQPGGKIRSLIWPFFSYRHLLQITQISFHNVTPP